MSRIQFFFCQLQNHCCKNTGLVEQATIELQFSVDDEGKKAVFLHCKIKTGIAMNKLKNEAALFKEALLAGVKYAEGRGAVEFEATDSASEKLLYIYRLLVHDKVIQPLPEEQVAEKTLRHKLAIWYAKQLPKDHPLLN